MGKTILNGNINKIQPGDHSAHDWYRFVLSFPPHLVRDYLERFQASEGSTVLDPFCGTGTTLVECKKLGISSVGIEANPMASFASKTKTTWNRDSEELLRASGRVAEGALSEIEANGLQDDQFFTHTGGRAKFVLEELPEEKLALLLKRSISPVPLHKALVLLRHIDRSPPHLVPHQRLAFAKSLVASSSNLHFGPEVGVGKIKDDAPVVGPWCDAISMIATDLRELHSKRDVPCDILHSDARNITEFLTPNSIDVVFTSPPYPNEKDYTRTTRLESTLLGFINSKKELREMKQGLLRSDTRNVYVSDEDDKWVMEFPRVKAIAEEIERRRIEMNKTSGFERLYHRVAQLYFGGMARHFASLRPFLKPGAMLGYVVGDQASFLRVMIRTGEILAEIAESLGYELVKIDLFRTRLATATREQLREEVVVLRWPGNEK